MKRSLFISFAATLVCFSIGLSSGTDLKVIAEQARIYAEPDSHSYLIETVKRGTSLSLFQIGKIRKEWYYIVFFSEKRKGRVSGFIQESMVVAASGYEEMAESTPLPPLKTVLEAEYPEKDPDFRLEQELSTTPLEKSREMLIEDGGSLQNSKISPPAAMDSLAFREILEIPVEIGKSRAFVDLSWSDLEGRAFLKISEPPVEIQAKSVPAVDAAPEQAVIHFRTEKEPVLDDRKEKFSETPLLVAVAGSDRTYEEEKILRVGKVLLEQVAPIQQERAFLVATEPPVDLEGRELPFVSWPPTQEVSVFEVIEVKAELSEELAATPLSLRPDSLFRANKRSQKDGYQDEYHSMASPVMDGVSFREMIEPAVELAVKPIQALTDFPEKETVIFRNTLEPPVELNPPKMPDLARSALQEIRGGHVFEEAPSEELSMTPLLEINQIGSLGNNGGHENRDDEDGLPVLNFFAEDALAFQKITMLPLEIASGSIPSVNPSPKMEGLAFQRPQESAVKTVEVNIPNIEQSRTKKKEVSSEMKISRPKTEKPQEEIKPQPFLVQPRKERDKFRWFTLGLGYGQSLGGVGGFLQFNTRAGVSVHGGIGYYPSTYIYSPHDWVKNVILFNAGIKYYLPLSVDPLHVYLDVQYGGIGVEAAQVITGIWHYSFVFENKQKTLWGPSFLAGVEFRMGHVGLNGALGFSYNLTKLDWSVQNYFLTFDIGLLLLF